MYEKVLGLSIALSYPDEAFKGVSASVIERGATLVRRAGQGESVAVDVDEFLRCQPRVNEWIAQLLEDHSLRPPHLRPRAVRSYQKLTGENSVVSAPRYKCPNDRFTWYRAFEFDRVPHCELCGNELFRA